jgi:hypothetical protein
MSSNRTASAPTSIYIGKTRVAATGSGSLLHADEKLTAFLELEGYEQEQGDGIPAHRD